MLKIFKPHFFLVLSMCLLFACGDSDAPQEKVTASEEKTVPMPAEVSPTPVAESVEAKTDEGSTEMAGDTEETVTGLVEEVKEEAQTVAETVSGDKPYQIIDGKISQNAIEGWKTYNGGGCGACHGKGGVGAVGPNLGQSVTQKLSKDEFVETVTNGKPGTMMRPHKTNTRVMDNLDNLYAYLVARGDGVLGPENLIKYPMGKSE